MSIPPLPVFPCGGYGTNGGGVRCGLYGLSGGCGSYGSYGSYGTNGACGSYVRRGRNGSRSLRVGCMDNTLTEDIRRVALVASQKGGVGKTTSVGALAHSLARLGCRVLVIDFAPNASFTHSQLGWHDLPDDALTISEVLKAADPKTTTQSIRRAPDQWQPSPETSWEDGGALRAGGVVDVIPGSSALQSAADEPVMGATFRLRRALEGVASNYDLVLMDSDPGSGNVMQTAMAAAGSVVSTTEPATSAANGVIAQLDFLDDCAVGWSLGVRFVGTLVVGVDRRMSVTHRKPLVELWDSLAGLRETEDWGPATTPFTVDLGDGVTLHSGGLLPEVIPHSAVALQAESARSPAAVMRDKDGLGLKIGVLYTRLGVRLLGFAGSPALSGVLSAIADLSVVWPLPDDTVMPDPWRSDDVF